MSDLHKVPAATVSGRDVSLHDLLAFLKQQDKLAFLHEAIEGLLVKQAIAQCGITVSDAELQGALDTFRRQHGLYKSAETHQWLEQHSMTSNDLEARLEYDVAAEKLCDHVTADTIERYFAEHQVAFDTARIAHIIVQREGMASEIISQITEEDADFAALAQQYSLDDASKLAGGYVGIVHRKALSPALEAAIFAASPGAIVGPVKTDLGYHVIHVRDIYPAQLDDRTRATIRDFLYGEWLGDMVRKADVRLLLLEIV